eukprot:5898963-Pyramimonas_sp.AAC.1
MSRSLVKRRRSSSPLPPPSQVAWAAAFKDAMVKQYRAVKGRAPPSKVVTGHRPACMSMRGGRDRTSGIDQRDPSIDR